MRILSLAPLAGPGLDELRALGDLELDPWNAHVPFRLHSAAELIERLTETDMLIVEADHVPGEVLRDTDLRFIGVTRGDPNNIDIAAATKEGIVVIRTPGRNANAVAELTLAFMLTLLRHIPRADADIRAGRWIVDGTLPQQRSFGRELTSCVVGVVGCGAIGRLVAQKVTALGARARGYDPVAHPEHLARAGIEPADDLGELFATSDIVTLHAPLNDDTRAIVSRPVLAEAKPGLLLINTARYGLVEEQALLDALREGRIAAAAFDHFHNEVLPPEHPLVSMPNVVLTPHIGGSTYETIENHTTMIARGLAAVLRGEVPETVANPEVFPLP